LSREKLKAKRIRQQSAVSRALLLDATERLMVLEGYASVTTRRVASMVGLTGALVHYYYPTTEDLLVATYRRAVERHDERVRQALGSDRPLHALWSFYSDPNRMSLGVEFMAMANHRKIIRAEIREHDERDRRLQADALSSILADGNIDLRTCPPLCAAMLLSAISRGLVMDEILGISCAHRETRAFIERLLGQIERTRKSHSGLQRPPRRTKSAGVKRRSRRPPKS
jgi:AcrR family transcriptional regulator